MREYTVNGGNKIHVFDDVLSHRHRGELYTFCRLQNLHMGWNDTDIAEAQHHRYLHAILREEDLKATGLTQYLKNSELAGPLEGLTLSKSVLNVSVTSDCHWTHTHGERKVVLFYVNQEWKDNWHGETLFFSENGEDIVFASRYVPGRVIVFDGAIPHALRPQSREGPQYRYTLAAIFDGDDA
jgi:hypothetical protein